MCDCKGNSIFIEPEQKSLPLCLTKNPSSQQNQNPFLTPKPKTFLARRDLSRYVARNPNTGAFFRSFFPACPSFVAGVKGGRP